MKLSPTDIAVLLQIYSVPGLHVIDSVGRLRSNGLIEPDGNHFPAKWKTTERGNVYCKAIYDMPLPVATWSMPKEG